MRYWLLLVGTLLLSRGTAAQACGGGEYSCRVYVPNGSPSVELRYELVALKPMRPDSLASLLVSDVRHRFTKLLLNRGVTIVPQDVDRLRELGVLRRGLPLGTPRPGPGASVEPFPHTGPVRQGVLTFQTVELYFRPCLLKLTAGSTVLYMLCNPFGGCSRTANILWGEYPEVVGTRWD